MKMRRPPGWDRLINAEFSSGDNWEGLKHLGLWTCPERDHQDKCGQAPCSCRPTNLFLLVHDWKAKPWVLSPTCRISSFCNCSKIWAWLHKAKAASSSARWALYYGTGSVENPYCCSPRQVSWGIKLALIQFEERSIFFFAVFNGWSGTQQSHRGWVVAPN